jgi:hypothetical protein
MPLPCLAVDCQQVCGIEESSALRPERECPFSIQARRRHRRRFERAVSDQLLSPAGARGAPPWSLAFDQQADHAHEADRDQRDRRDLQSSLAWLLRLGIAGPGDGRGRLSAPPTGAPAAGSSRFECSRRCPTVRMTAHAPAGGHLCHDTSGQLLCRIHAYNSFTREFHFSDGIVRATGEPNR